MVKKSDGKARASVPAQTPRLPVDEHHGLGGSYVLENGRRRLVERTVDPDDTDNPGPADAGAEL